jgi:hypothetical protein
VKEVKEVKNKTSRVFLIDGDFSFPQLPLLPQPPSLPFLKRKFLVIRLACSLAILGAALTFAPIGFAQAGKPPESAKTQDKAAPLSHDLSGVWMQYRDGDVPGTPGMNGVNEHFRPPLTSWGQAQFDNAQAL